MAKPATHPTAWTPAQRRLANAMFKQREQSPEVKKAFPLIALAPLFGKTRGQMNRASTEHLNGIKRRRRNTRPAKIRAARKR